MSHGAAHDADFLNAVECLRILGERKAEICTWPQGDQYDGLRLTVAKLVENFIVGRDIGRNVRLFGAIRRASAPEVFEEVGRNEIRVLMSWCKLVMDSWMRDIRTCPRVKPIQTINAVVPF